ncbi:cysteine desulfurase-like protein [Agrococcus sp. SGAir0287]|uniref:cysteine desulfurase-like protein n=1 Tax=Agrococcus sp. SGAir0287 TaxID=2070347 RepID=UPI0010CCC5D6|nr:cysteine desulfurase-like protein [Agrococcus sp. SGAir0287]QCR18160.1 cysteine desulfurase-like protein [Agrococcus sp. SGAir0287]
MDFDVAAFRERFPSLASGIAHFDGPGGTQTPREVGAAIADTLTGPLSNRGRQVASARAADDAVTAFRQAYADLLGVPPTGIVHGRSATQLTFDLARALAKTWRAGDEVVVSRLDHDANVRPWIIAAESVGATVRWIDFDPATAEVDVDAARAQLTERTRLVAITGASNVLGTKPPVRAIADAAHALGALVHVDAVHLAAHAPIDVAELGADLLVCSPYKLLGPHCGVLAADPALLDTIHPDKLAPSSDAVPERFELGTLPYEVLAGATAAVDVLASLSPTPHAHRRDRISDGLHAIDAHETRLRERIERELTAFGDDVVLHSRASDRTPTLLVTLPGRSTAEAAQHLADRDVAAPSGSFYALEPFRRLALPGDEALRAGLAPYVDDRDVDRLLEGLAEFLGR